MRRMTSAPRSWVAGPIIIQIRMICTRGRMSPRTRPPVRRKDIRRKAAASITPRRSTEHLMLPGLVHGESRVQAFFLCAFVDKIQRINRPPYVFEFQDAVIRRANAKPVALDHVFRQRTKIGAPMHPALDRHIMFFSRIDSDNLEQTEVTGLVVPA